jgi:hypothetical protein
MSKTSVHRCSECYFRNAGLCALPGETPCPTFRASTKTLVPPRQAPLIARPAPVLVAAAG